MKKILFASIILLITANLFSQNIENYLAKAPTEKVYKLMMTDMSINFYDVCKAADIYFQTHDPKVKGSGWKGYARWKNANEYKYYPSGNRRNIDPAFTQKAFQSFLKNNPQQTASNYNRSSSRAYTGWKDLGPYRVDSITGHYSAGMGRVVAVYVDPSDTNTIYVGSRTGGFWKTTNGGTNWTVTTDFLFATGVNTIDASPTNSDSVLINVNNARNHYSHGIYRSINGGNTWTVTNFNPTNLGKGGLGSSWRINKVKYHPTIPNLIFVATSDGLYRSTNNLSTWARITTSSVSQIEFHPTDPDIMFIYEDYYWGSNKNAVLRSTDQGLNFTASNTIVGNNNSTSVRLSVSNDCANCLYFASTNGIWISSDTAKNFTLLGTSSESCLGFSVNDTDTSNMIYGYVDIDRSTNGGRTWTDATRWSLGSTNGSGFGNQVSYNISTNYVHADLQDAICVNGVFYVVTDGTISKSNDKGISWKNIGQGLGTRMNYRLGASQSNHFRAICGSQDNGTSIMLKDTWIEFYGADGMESLIHPLNDDWMIGSVQYGTRIGTKNGGQTLGFFPRPVGQYGSGNAYWEAPFAYNPNNQMTVYHFSNHIYKSENFGSTWDSLSSPSSFIGSITTAAVAENNSNIIIVSKGSAIDKSTDGGLTWTDIKGTLPNSSIQDIAFDPNNDEVIIVVYASYQNNNQKIYKTTNGGTSWTNITYNLGNMPIHSVVIDHQDASNIYIGAEIGVYTMPMNSSTWSLYNTDLPNVSIQELEIVYGSNSIKAAAWGRGLWEYTLVGRNNFPRIMTTKITNTPTEIVPKENIDQFVTSTISYANTLSSVNVEWSKDSATFGNMIPMTNVSDSTWVSNSAIPNQVSGTKMYFKVFAVGNNNDTSETYKFMYTVKENKYCESSGTIAYQGNITLVQLDSINNATGKTAAYTDYTLSDSAVLKKGESYNLTVNLNTDNNNYKYHASVWIDWNQNIIFETNERYDLGSATNVTDGPTNASPFSITVPNNAKTGKTRMRVASKYNSAITDPCLTGSDGETEDYTIIVKNSTRLSFNLNENSICRNEKIHFNYTGDSISSILWTFISGTDSLTSTNKTDSLIVPNPGTYKLNLQAMDSSSNTITLDTNAVFIVNDSSSFTLNLTSCNPSDTGVTTTTLVNANGCDSILTTKTTLVPGPTTSVNLTSCDPSKIGTTKDTLTSFEGCDSIVTTTTTLSPSYKDTIYSTTCDQTKVGTTSTNDTTTMGCDSITTTIKTLGTIGASITVSGLILTANPSGLSYQWLYCNNGNTPISGETNQTYTATINGSYAVKVYDMDCKDTATCFQVMNVGIVSNSFENKITLFPNPTSGILGIDMNGDFKIVTVRVTNELGQEILSTTESNSNFNVDITNHSPGIYFLHLTSDGKKAVFKVIKND